MAVVAALVAGIGAGAALGERSAALNGAKRTAAHLLLVQRAQIELVQADSDASNAYLQFGPEPVAQRQDYLASMAAASRDIAAAARFSPQDAAAMAEANSALTRYSSYQASARALNSQSVLVGASYLATASELLRSDVLPRLRSLSTRDQKQVSADYSRSARALWLFLASVLLGLGGLIYAQVWLGRRFRRILNVPLAACSAILLVTLAVGLAAISLAESRANDVRAGSLAKAVALSRSRVAAFDAKSIESLTVVKRGSATTADASWSAAMKTATSALSAGNSQASSALSSYAVKHRALNTLHANGDWQQAKDLAIGTSASSANRQFQTYAAVTKSALTQQAAAASSGLDSAGAPLWPARLLVLAGGFVCAAGAWWGFSPRLDEYR